MSIVLLHRYLQKYCRPELFAYLETQTGRTPNLLPLSALKALRTQLVAMTIAIFHNVRKLHQNQISIAIEDPLEPASQGFHLCLHNSEDVISSILEVLCTHV